MSEGASQTTGRNTPDPKILGELFKSHFRIEDDKNSVRMSMVKKIGEYNEQQAQVRARVKDAGLSVRAFKELVAEETDRRRIANRKAKLDDDEIEAFELMAESLGQLADLPLGKAAQAAAETKKATARGASKKALNDELDQMGSGDTATNVTRLKRGIETLN